MSETKEYSEKLLKFCNLHASMATAALMGRGNTVEAYIYTLRMSADEMEEILNKEKGDG